MKNVTLPVAGMTCASCAIIVEKTLNKIPGVEKCEVNIGNEKATVNYDETKVDIATLNSKIEPLGYSLKDKAADHKEHVMADGSTMSGMDHSAHLGLNQTKTEKIAELNAMWTKILFAVPSSFLIFLMMMWDVAAKSIPGIPMFPVSVEIYNSLMLIMSSVVIFWIGQPFLKATLIFARYRVANMDSLVGIGTLTAYIYSLFIVLFPTLRAQLNLPDHTYFDVTIVVIGFISLGKYLEARSKLKTGDAIEKLIDLQAKTALVERNGVEQEITLAEVVIGDVIIVKPGSKIPVDGKIVYGNSAIDESMITGEAIPVDKNIGDEVIGGTINKFGALKFTATKVGSETMLAKIVKMVEHAQGSRAPIQKLADEVSAIFVPVVLVIAILTLLTWLILGSIILGPNQAISLAILNFVGVLIIACPCALGLATPTAIIVGVGKAATHGILIKNAESLQKLHQVDTLVFDKTGTITNGKPVVTDIISLDGDYSETRILQVSAALEKLSEHPLALAVIEKAQTTKLAALAASDFKVIPGKGLTAKIDDQNYFLGNTKLIADLHLKNPNQKFEELSQEGKTVVMLATETKIIGLIAIADTIKPNAKEAVAELHKLGIRLIMLTGDNRQTADFIAQQIGIDDVIAEVLPGDKAAKILELQTAGKIVGMVGDGVNDAPALAQANVGIAMSTGTDVAIEAADITLLAGDISKVRKALMLSRQTMRTIKQNLFWAFIYNIVGIPLAAGLLYPVWGILLSPAIAGLAMAFSSVSVVTNSLRLKLSKI